MRVSLYCDNVDAKILAIDGNSTHIKPSGMIQIVNNRLKLGAICSELHFGQNEVTILSYQDF